MCGGYYKYSEGYTPEFPGAGRFKGRIAHPQKWTEDIEYEGKRVVVIGSGATAVTLVPEIAKKALHVTMLQRSPTYVVARPAEDHLANTLRRFLPAMLAYGITRWKQVLLQMYFFNLCRRNPVHAKKLILGGVRAYLGPDYDVDTHFTPRYNPWAQRLCLVPDADLFTAIQGKKVSVVTDHIETFTEKGLMYSGVPNLASSFGYTNASWTLKCDLTCEYVCRLLNCMKKRGYAQCVPRLKDPSITEEPWIDFSSGYVRRSLDKFPKQGSKAPWKLRQNYTRDIMTLRFGRIDDGVMELSNPPSAHAERRD